MKEGIQIRALVKLDTGISILICERPNGMDVLAGRHASIVAPGRFPQRICILGESAKFNRTIPSDQCALETVNSLELLPEEASTGLWRLFPESFGRR